MRRVDLDDPAQCTLPSVLRRQAEAIPDAAWLAAGTARFCFGRANELANAWAQGLRRLGVRQGDAVAFLMKGCPEFVFATFGAMKLGAIWVPTNVDYKGEWLRASLVESRARVLVADAALLPRVAEVAAGLFEHVVVRGAGDGGGLRAEVSAAGEIEGLDPKEPEGVEIQPGDTAAVLWTSGTTGRAKGVMQSHHAWLRGAVNGAETSGTREGDVLYCCLPLYNSAAWVACLYRALVTGLCCGLDPEFSASLFWERTRHYGATQVFTLGAMHMFLWNAPARPDDADNPVRHATMIPMPDAIVDRFCARFGIETLDQGYGQSEVMGILHRTAQRGRRWQPGCLGEPLPGIELRLLGDDDREVAPGEVGEFCVRPLEPFVLFNGYWHDPEASVRAFRNLWYHTGDLGRRDPEGDWYFVDRKADFMRYKGRNVSSFAVEAAVGAHPAVAECAAHGVPSDELESESEIKVCVVLKPGQQLAPEALARFVNETAPHFFVPRYVELVDELPHTPTGRVQKYRLRERGVTAATWDARRAGFRVER